MDLHWRDNKFHLSGSMVLMLRYARIALAVVVVALGVGFLVRALGLQGFGGELGDIGVLILMMLLVSLTDRELFWPLPPKHERRR
jgi:hypothetical protein